jgi:hypothetical protein
MVTNSFITMINTSFDLNNVKVGDFIVDLVWDENVKQNKVVVNQVIAVRPDSGDYKNGVIKVSEDLYVITHKVTKHYIF